LQKFLASKFDASSCMYLCGIDLHHFMQTTHTIKTCTRKHDRHASFSCASRLLQVSWACVRAIRTFHEKIT